MGSVRNLQAATSQLGLSVHDLGDLLQLLFLPEIALLLLLLLFPSQCLSHVHGTVLDDSESELLGLSLLSSLAIRAAICRS